MRAGIFSGDAAARPATSCSRACARSPAMARRRPGRRGQHRRRAYVVPAGGRAALHRRRARPRHQDARPRARIAERGIEVHVLPSTATLERDARRRARRGVPLQRPRRPGHRRPRGRAGARRCSRPRIPLFGICFGNQILGRALGLRHLQAALRPPRHQPAGASTTPPARSRSPRRTTASPSTAPLDASSRHPVRPRRGQPHLPQRRRRRGRCAASTCRRSRCSTTRRRRPARTTPPTCSTGSCDLMEGERRLMPSAVTDFNRVLVIGSGPIVIGQACEFDYSGTQACRVLRAEGLRVILVNSNPATIMTDPEFADATYVEPITPEFVEKIIAKERPDALLATLGGQTALNTAIALHEAGVLEKYDVELIGANFEAIQRGEDRADVQGDRRQIGRRPSRPRSARLPHDGRGASPRSTTSATRSSCGPRSPWAALGSGIAYDEDDLHRIAGAGLAASPTTKVLLEESILGWKEYELELMRDHSDNVVVVCSIENVDPMGVHTGDSITVAPALTLTDREYQKLRDIGIAIIREVGVDTGGCNIQFAVDPDDGRIIVIEMNPRVSRSSALASKATGFPIAKIAAKLAIGYTLDEIPNDITERDAGLLRADARLRRGQGAAVRVREVPRRRPHADHDDEVGRRGDGDRPQLHRGAAEGAALAGDARTRRFYWDGATPDVDVDDAARRGRASRTDGRLRDGAAGAAGRCHRRAGCTRPPASTRGSSTRSRCSTRSRDDLVARARARRPSCCAWPSGTASPTRRSARCAALPEDVVRGVRHALGIRPVYKTVDTCAAEFAAQHAVPLLDLRRGDRGRAARDARRCSSSARDPTASARASSSTTRACTPHDAARGGLRDRHGQLQPRDRLDRLRHQRPALLRAAHVRGRARGLPRRARSRARSPASSCSSAARPRSGSRSRSRTRACRSSAPAPRRSTWPRTAARSAACSRRRTCPRRRTAPRRASTRPSRSPTDIGYPVLVRPSYVLGGRGMEIVYDEPTLHDYIARATRGRRPSTRCSSTGSSTTRSRSTSTRCATATSSTSAASWSTSRRPASTPATRRARCRRSPSGTARSTGSAARPRRSPRRRRARPAQRAVRAGRRRALRARGQPARLAHRAVRVQGHRGAAGQGGRPGHAGRHRSPSCAPRACCRRTATAARCPSTRPIAVKEAVLPFGRFHGVDTVLGPEMQSTGEVMGIDAVFGTRVRQVADRGVRLGPADQRPRVRLGGQPRQALDGVPGQAAGRPRLRDPRHRGHRRGAAPQRSQGHRGAQAARRAGAGRRADHRRRDQRRRGRHGRQHPVRRRARASTATRSAPRP